MFQALGVTAAPGDKIVALTYVISGQTYTYPALANPNGTLKFDPLTSLVLPKPSDTNSVKTAEKETLSTLLFQNGIYNPATAANMALIDSNFHPSVDAQGNAQNLTNSNVSFKVSLAPYAALDPAVNPNGLPAYTTLRSINRRATGSCITIQWTVKIGTFLNIGGQIIFLGYQVYTFSTQWCFTGSPGGSGG